MLGLGLPEVELLGLGLPEVELLGVVLPEVELLGIGLLGGGPLAGRLPLEMMLELEAPGVAVDAATECGPPMNPTVTSPPTRAAMAEIKPAAAVMAPGRDRQNSRLCPSATV